MTKNNKIFKKDILLRMGLLFLLVLLAVKTDYGQADQTHKQRGFFLRSGGGIAFLSGGDYGNMIQLNVENNSDLIDIKETSFFKSIGGEIGYDFGKFMVGFESGFISRSFNVVVDDGYYHGPWEHRFSAVPLLLNLYVRVMNRDKWRSYLLAGGGLYLGKYEETWDWSYEPIQGERQTGWEESKAIRLGGHLGGNIEYLFNHWISVFFETRFKFVPFRNIRGKGHYSYTSINYEEDYEGDLYYLSDGILTGFYIGDDFSPIINHGEKAKIDLKGLALTFGVRLRF